MASAATADVPSRWGKRHLVFASIVLVNFTIWLDEGIFGALTPYWSADLGLTPSQIGTGSAAYLLTYFLMLFVSGVLCDRFGARPLLAIAIIGCSALSAAMVLVDDYQSLVIRNLAFGLFFGLLWAPCNRLIAIWLPAHERAKYAAIWMSSTMFSFVVATPLGLFVAQYADWRTAFLFATALGVPSLIVLLVATRERPELWQGIARSELDYIYGGRDVAEEIDAGRFRWSDLRALLVQPSVLWMIVATSLATTPTWFIVTWGTYGLVNGFRLDAGEASLLSSSFILIPVAAAFLIGWIINTLAGGRCRPVLAAGAAISGVAFLLVGLLPPTDPLVWGVLIFGGGFLVNPFFWGTINAYWAGLARPEYLGTLSGVSAAAQVAVGFGLISLSGGWIDEMAPGAASLSPIWLVGGTIFLTSLIPIFLAREVSTRSEVLSGTLTPGK